MSRLFVAIRPPAPVRETLLAAMDDDPAIRWQDDDQLHLTLAFLGEVDRGAERDLADALTAIDSPPFAIRVATTTDIRITRTSSVQGCIACRLLRNRVAPPRHITTKMATPPR